jgi:TolA-binding protein
MNFISKFIVVLIGFSLTQCTTFQKSETERYQTQVNRLSKQLKKQEDIAVQLKDENMVLRQLAGVPESALTRVKKEGKKDLKVYSEKFLYSQIVDSFKKEDAIKLSRSLKVFLQHYPKSQRADNAIYYKGLLDLRSGRLAESLEEFDRVLDLYPKANKRPSATLGKALAYKALNLKDQSKLLLEVVIKKYPKTPESIRAKRELREIETL